MITKYTGTIKTVVNWKRGTCLSGLLLCVAALIIALVWLLLGYAILGYVSGAFAALGALFLVGFCILWFVEGYLRERDETEAWRRLGEYGTPNH